MGRSRRLLCAASPAAWLALWLTLAVALRRASAVPWQPGDILLEGTARNENGKLYRTLTVLSGGNGRQLDDPITLYPHGPASPTKLTRPSISSDGEILVSLGVPAEKPLSLVVVTASGDNPRILAVLPLVRYLSPADPQPLLGAVDIDRVYDAANATIPGQYAVFCYGLDPSGGGPVLMRWFMQLAAAEGGQPTLRYVEAIPLQGALNDGGAYHDYFNIQVYRPYEMVLHAMIYDVWQDGATPRLEAYTLNWFTKGIKGFPLELGASQPPPTLLDSGWQVASVPGGFLTLLKSRGAAPDGAATDVYTCTLVKVAEDTTTTRTASILLLPGEPTDDWYGLVTDGAREGGPKWYWSLRQSSPVNATAGADRITEVVKISIEDGSSPGAWAVAADPIHPNARSTALGIVRTPRDYPVRF